MLFCKLFLGYLEPALKIVDHAKESRYLAGLTQKRSPALGAMS